MNTITPFELLQIQPAYKSPKGFMKWDAYIRKLAITTPLTLIKLAKQASSGSMEIKDDDELNIKHAKGSYAHLVTVLGLRSPAFFIAENLLDAFAETLPPTLYESIELPFDSFHLMLPNNYLGFGEHGLLVHLRKHFPSVPDPRFPDGCLMMHVGMSTRKSYAPFSAFLPFNTDQFLITPDVADSYWGMGDEISDILKAMQQLSVGYILQAIFILLHRPELVNEESPKEASGTGFSLRSKCAPYLPTRWIGKYYQRKSEKTAPTGSHASPRAHWRKGHWHNFRHGPGRKELKLKWIEPIFVNP